MNGHIHLEQIFGWLLNRSWQAGMLVACVLLVQWIFRRSLANRWRFALWWIVLARLLLPFEPASQLSLFNCFRQFQVPPIVREQSPAPPSTVISGSGAVENIVPPQSALSQPSPKTQSMGFPTLEANIPSKSPVAVEKETGRSNVQNVIFIAALACWSAGATLLTVIVLTQVFGMIRRLSRSATPTDRLARELLMDCCREMRVSRNIELLETDAVKSPALFGLFRLRLLLPRGLSGSFNRDELRYIFLHELAHVRRGDLWLNCLITMMQILHWFNPLLWLGFARLRADRELACDELVLRQTGEKAAEAYGLTILKLLQGIQRPTAMPGLVGILEDRNQMRRRISRIAGFKMPRRWSALAVLLLAGLGIVALTDAQQERTSTNSNLTGSIETRAGQPIDGTVFICTAGPKVGTSTFCPSCYADCQKSAKADAQGKFEIKSLDPQLIFRILAVAPGYKPRFVTKVDPTNGPVIVQLSPIEMAAAPPGNCLHGRVAGTNGMPIAGAEVDYNGIRMFNGAGGWGQRDGVDPIAVTDDKGEFLITSLKPFDMMDVSVRARGYADKKFVKLASGDRVHQLILGIGATVSGRVIFNGRPLANIEMEISTVDQVLDDSTTAHFNIGTDSNGRFTFINLPPNADYNICGTMDSLERFGAIPTQVIHAGDDGSKTEAGDLIVTPGHRLAGRVVLSDGKPIPLKTQLFIGRDRAWDSIELELPPDGNFALNNVPSETYNLSVRVPGYELSPKNGSFDTMNPGRLIGRVNEDTTNLTILLEHGKRSVPQDTYGNDQSEWPQNRPLGGVGGNLKPDHSQDWIVSGRVTDAQTGEPLNQFSATPGDENLSFRQIHWDQRDAANGTNGFFSVYMNKRWEQPVIKVEAEGYLPQSITITPLEQTNADFALNKGNGPSGIVRLPDGKPAVNAEVLLICPDTQNPSLDGDGHLRPGWPRDDGVFVKTGSDGRFAFGPRLGMQSVAAASPDGFGRVSISGLATNPNITLEPFASVKGTVERPNGPGTNEDLDLAFIAPDSMGRLGIFNSAHTDSGGHFQFNHIPAGDLQLSYRVPVSQNGWQNADLQQITVEPGQTLLLNVNAPARQTATGGFGRQSPPPPPARISGVEVTGSVFLPDGRPAANAQVALQIKGQFMQLGKASIISYDGWNYGSVLRADKNGKFSLPMYKGAQTVIAVSDGGFARIPVVDLKQSRRIVLQPWASIEGTLRIGHHAGANQVVAISQWGGMMTGDSAQPQPLFLDPSVYQAKTDSQGHFVLTYIPPGTHQLYREVPEGDGWRGSETLGIVDFKPGETKRITFGGNGRTVVGKVTVEATSPKDWQQGHLYLSTVSTFEGEFKAARTQEQRMKIMRSPQYQKAMMNMHNYPATLLPDGSFSAEDVVPGKYELGIQFFKPGAMARPPVNARYLLSKQQLTVPKAAGTNDAPVNLGTITLRSIKIPPLMVNQTNTISRN